MDDKSAVTDMLASINSVISNLTYSIQQSNDKSFRDALIKARTDFEKFQWDIYNIAKDNMYYIPAAPAGKADILAVKQAISK